MEPALILLFIVLSFLNVWCLSSYSVLSNCFLAVKLHFTPLVYNVYRTIVIKLNWIIICQIFIFIYVILIVPRNTGNWYVIYSKENVYLFNMPKNGVVYLYTRHGKPPNADFIDQHFIFADKLYTNITMMMVIVCHILSTFNAQ